MGSLFGGRLAGSGFDVTLVDVWQEHVEWIATDGLQITTPDGAERTVDVAATTDPESVGNIDLVIVFVKSTQTATAMADAKALFEGDVDVLTLQNGLGNPETIAEFVSEESSSLA